MYVTDSDVMFIMELLVRFCNARVREPQGHPPVTQHVSLSLLLLSTVITLL